MQSKKNSNNSQSATALKKPNSSIYFQGPSQNKKTIHIDKSQKRNIDAEDYTNRNNKKCMNYSMNDNTENNKKLKPYCSQKISQHHEQSNQQDSYSQFLQRKLINKQEKSLIKNIKNDKEHKSKKQKQEKSGLTKAKKKQNKAKQSSQKGKNKIKNKENSLNSNSNSCSMFRTFVQNDSTMENTQNTHRNGFAKTHKNTKSQLLSGNQSPSKIKNKMVIDLRIKQKGSYQSTHRSTNRVRGKIVNKTPQLQDLPSTRQYCIIKGKFVPLQSSTDRKYVDQMLEQTATTSPDPTHKAFINKIKCQDPKQNTQQNNQKIHYNTYNNYNKNLKIQTTNQTQIGIQTIKTQLAHYQVLVKAAQQDIGIQYSDRSAQNSNRKLLQDKIKFENILLNEYKNNKVIQQQNEQNQQQKSERTTLLETMMKLQSLQLDQNCAIQNLDIQQKRHFRQICETLLTKMKSPRIQNPPNISRTQQIIQIQKIKTLTKSSITQVQNQIIFQQVAQIQQNARNQQLQHLLMLRESKQTNQFNTVLRSPQHIDTSLIAVLSIFSDLFCYIQMSYENNLLQNINSYYGLSYGDKYKFISNYYGEIRRSNKMRSNLLKLENTSIAEMIKIETLKKQLVLKPIPDALFMKFKKQMSENESQQQDQQQEQQNQQRNKNCKVYSPQQIQKLQQLKVQTQSYLWIHNKCIFDCINQLMVTYKPFYPTKGDPFVWTVSPLKCLTFYSIDSQSLQTVIQQMQQRMSGIVKNLCGIHVESNKYIAGNYMEKQQNKDWNKDIVFCCRRQKINKAIAEEQKNQNSGGDDYLLKEIQQTCVIYQISMFLQDYLFKQFYNEFKQLNQKRII